MQAADTNVWARAYLNDDARQAQQARKAISDACAAEGIFVPLLVLAKLFWVLAGVQSGRLQLLINGQPEKIDEGPLASMPDAAANVAGIYAMLRDDILNNTRTVPDFDHAVRLHRFVDAVLRSSLRGAREGDSGWPIG